MTTLKKGILGLFFRHRHQKLIRKFIIICLAIIFILGGSTFLWIASFKIPDLNSFNDRQVSQSTKIYDRTGQVLLYDVFEGIKRNSVPLNKISVDLRNATVAIEDSEFYQHNGIRLSSIFRAILANIGAGSYSQGGSTITQQVVKNSLLTTEKSITRKIKELVLSLKLERMMTKDQILEVYLNENPYGGSIYGVEEASKTFFGKSASDLDLAESAYIAALPQAPTLYSPYGNNKSKLEDRKNLVLFKMLDNKFISQENYDKAKAEKVTFKPQEKTGIKAPHFVTFIKQYLEEKYGTQAIQERGLKVITTINYDLQQKTEELVKKYALGNKTEFNAENAAMVAIDPRTGQILSMVGSRDYFDKDIDGNFNVALAHRQPGSTFKPFVYATAFNRGYTPDTVLFDVPTEFQSTCNAVGTPIDPSTNPEDCYMPQNYDGNFVGPISLRNALAQSRNVPAIKTLYLAGIADSIRTARNMGIESLGTPEQYGLTLVLGGGEVSLLDMTSAYSVFANYGIRNKYTGIIHIEDKDGNVLEDFTPKPEEVLNKNTALQITSILSDNQARSPVYGLHSALYFPGRDVAAKTGTTNDYKDGWIMGYTPSITIGTWVGNNNNTPMDKKVAGTITGPMFMALMKEALKIVPDEKFEKPQEIDKQLKPVLRGFWQGNDTFFIDKFSGLLATELTPSETREEKSITNIHSILYWVDKKNPLGPKPENPASDYQFSNWEYSIQNWLLNHPQSPNIPPLAIDNIHTEQNKPKIEITNPVTNTVYNKTEKIFVRLSISAVYPIDKIEYYLNGNYKGVTTESPFLFSFTPSEDPDIQDNNELKLVVYDKIFNRGESIINLQVK